MTWPAVGMVNGRGYIGQQKTPFATLIGHTERFEAHLSKFFANFDLFVTFTSCLDA